MRSMQRQAYCALVVGALVATLGSWQESWASSTEPIRSRPHETVNPLDTSNPIYYPVSLSAAAGVETVEPEALLRQFMERHTAMDYPAAAEIAFRLVAAAPDRPEGHYNLACVM